MKNLILWSLYYHIEFKLNSVINLGCSLTIYNDFRTSTFLTYTKQSFFWNIQIMFHYFQPLIDFRLTLNTIFIILKVILWHLTFLNWSKFYPICKYLIMVDYSELQVLYINYELIPPHGKASRLNLMYLLLLIIDRYQCPYVIRIVRRWCSNPV